LPSPGLPPTWGAWDIFRFQALPTATALLPALLLAVLFVFGQGEGHSGIPGGGNPLSFPKYLLKQIMALSSFWIWEVAIYGGFGVLILWIAIRNWQKNNTIFGWNGFLILILVCLSILYVAPESMSGGSQIPPRLILFLLASLFFWLGLHIQRDGEKMAIIVVSFAISLGLLISYGVKYQELNKYLEEYVSGSDRVEMNATLLPICFSPKGFSVDNTFHSYPRTSPFIHASGYIAARRHVVEFTNFEAHMSFFPIRFRPGLDPYVHIGPVETIDKQIDFLSYPSRTGGRVDYVLVWGKNRGDFPPEVVESIAEQIREGYELIFTSERGSMMLYRRKGWPPEIDEGPVRRHTSGQRGGNYPVAEIVPHGRPGSLARPQVVPGLELEPVAAKGTGEGSERRSIVPGVSSRENNCLIADAHGFIVSESTVYRLFKEAG
jgi:hypothetical protein